MFAIFGDIFGCQKLPYKFLSSFKIKNVKSYGNKSFYLILKRIALS